jgi:hypothetical protein
MVGESGVKDQGGGAPSRRVVVNVLTTKAERLMRARGIVQVKEGEFGEAAAAVSWRQREASEIRGISVWRRSVASSRRGEWP